jgi:carbon-monoxide dehydrogenase medium subunit
MIPESFEYHIPKSLAEATRLAAELGEQGKFLAGGHSLLPMMKLRLASPRHLIDLGHLSDLRYIREADGGFEIGALTTHFQIESSALLQEKCPLLPETARQIGDVQVRNRGTLGGSLVHADPAADWPPAILALDAEIKAVSATGERWIAARDFFVELMATAIQPGEILSAIRVPALPACAADVYLKLRQPASGFAVVGAAVRLTLGESGHVGSVAIGMAGVGPKAYRAAAAERELAGKPPTARRLAEAAAHAADGVEANSDLFASAEYRRHLAAVYVRRALECALERAGQST